jgi:hypothetical protein
MIKSNYDFTTMLEEAKLKIDRQFASMGVIRDHGKLILGSSSIILSLFTFLKITSYQVKSEFLILYIVILLVMAIAFCRLIYFSIKVALLYPLEHAIDPTWETYIEVFKDEEERTILERLVHQYLIAITNNEVKLTKQYDIAIKLTWNMVMLIIIIIVIAFIMPFMGG